MTFKKAEIAKPLKNRISMIETNPLSHNWSDFMILTGLTLHQFQKKNPVKYSFINNSLSCRAQAFNRKTLDEQKIHSKRAESAAAPASKNTANPANPVAIVSPMIETGFEDTNVDKFKINND